MPSSKTTYVEYICQQKEKQYIAVGMVLVVREVDLRRVQEFRFNIFVIVLVFLVQFVRRMTPLRWQCSQSVRLPDSLDSFTHVQAHLHTVLGVLGQRDGQPGHTVVAVSQDLDPHALVLLWAARREEDRVTTLKAAGTGVSMISINKCDKKCFFNKHSTLV